MTWAAVIAGGSALISGVMGSQAAGSASRAQQQAANRALELQRENRNIGLTAYEPNRMLGYGATSDLSSLYGYATPGYTGLQHLLYPGATGGGIPASGGGSGGGGGGSGLGGFANGTAIGSVIGGLDPGMGILGGLTNGFGLLGGGGTQHLRGTINPQTGTVDVRGDHPGAEAALTAYLQGTGPEPLGGHGKYHDIKQQINNLRNAGWTYTPGVGGSAAPPGAGTGTPGTGQFPGDIPATPAGQPGNMSRFFASPDYNYRQQAGTSYLDRSAAARSGSLGGNAIAGGIGLSSNLAAGEYGNYVNRLLAMAGLGQTATAGAANTSSNYANNAGNLLQQSGDARASGIMGQANSVTGAVNSGMNNYLLMRYLQQQGTGG